MSKLEIYSPYIDESKILELLEQSYNFNFNKGQQGGTAMCILSGDYAVLYSNTFIENHISPEEFQKTMNLIYSLYSRNGRVAPILGYIRSRDNEGIFNAFVYKKHKFRDIIIVKKAPGQSLNNMNGYKQMVDKIKERLDSSQKHYDEVVNTFLQIIDLGVKPDISRNNLMFEYSKGFTFVDFNGLEKTRHLYLEYEKILYLKQHVARFLKSFVTDKKFQSEQAKEYYFSIAAKEQQMLCEKLFAAGISEEILEYSISEITDLDSNTLDKLYNR